MRVRIEDRNADGRGRGRAEGRVALVSQAHPGEEVVLRVDRSTRGTLQGRVARLLRRDPERLPHECEHEFHCTGCPLLAAPVPVESAFKRERIVSVLSDVDARLVERLEPVATPVGPFGHRHHAKQSFFMAKGAVRLGSYVAGTHRITDNSGCPVLAPGLTELMEAVARFVEDEELPLSDPEAGQLGLRHAIARQSRATGKQLLVLVSDAAPTRESNSVLAAFQQRRRRLVGLFFLFQKKGENVLLRGQLQRLAGAEWLEEDLLGFRHRIGPRSFFQVNPAAAEVLFARAVEMAGEGARCVEAYAGVGALTLPLARKFRRVDAIEADDEAAAELARATKGRRGIEVHAAAVESVLPKLLERPSDVVVLDPPRRGLGDDVTRALAESATSRVVLLSCEPATLARDLPPLLQAGFRLKRVAPVDQFPRTAHVETVSLLVREEGGRG